MNVKRYAYWVLCSLVFFLISTRVNYLLPVKYVFFGNDAQSKIYPISTVHGWELKIQEWDWVSSYRMGWRFPSSLLLSFEAKHPIARQPDGSYVAQDGGLFHLSGYDLPLIQLDVDSQHLKQGVALIATWQQWLDLESISESISGLVRIETKRGDSFYLETIDSHVSMPFLERWLSQQVLPQQCFILSSELISCEPLN